MSLCEGRDLQFTESEFEDFAAGARYVVARLSGGKKRQVPGAYNSWKHAKDRCFNSDSPAFRRYGGRGITMCDRWRISFANFLADMGDKPPGKTLDRIDNDGNYEPGNCRWATPLEQTRNQPHRRRFEWQGEMLSLSEVADKVGLDYQFLRHRIKRGVPLAEAISTPHRSSVGRAREAKPKKTRRLSVTGPAGKLPDRIGWLDVLAAEPSNVKAAALLGTTVKTIEHFRRRYVRPTSIPSLAGMNFRPPE